MTINIPIEPISGFVAESYLYSDNRNSLAACKVIGVSCYPGSALTLTILLNDGSLFCYLPLNSFCINPIIYQLSIKDLCYFNCPGGDVELKRFNLPEVVKVYFKYRDSWDTGRYFYTLDWYEKNELSHLIMLKSGFLCSMPNHKVKFGSSSTLELPKFKKIREEWKV